MLKLIKNLFGKKSRCLKNRYLLSKEEAAAKKAEEANKCPERSSPFEPCECNHARRVWLKNIACCGTYGLIVKICCDCRKEVDRRRVEWLPEDLARKYADMDLISYETWEKQQGKGSHLMALMEGAVGNIKYVADRAEGMQQR